MAKKFPKAVRQQIESIIRAAEFSRAAFDRPGEHMSADYKEYTAEVVAATKIYRDSWIIEPLRDLLDYDDGETTKDRLMYADFPF